MILPSTARTINEGWYMSHLIAQVNTNLPPRKEEGKEQSFASSYLITQVTNDLINVI